MELLARGTEVSKMAREVTVRMDVKMSKPQSMRGSDCGSLYVADDPASGVYKFTAFYDASSMSVTKIQSRIYVTFYIP
jgi:hypothetical protein